MNVLFLDQFSDLGGAQRCLLDLLPGILERGWRARVAAPGGRLLEEAAKLGTVVHPIPCGPYRSGYKSLGDALRFACQWLPLSRAIERLAGGWADLIYVNGPRLLPVAPRSRPVVFHLHSVPAQRCAVRLLQGAARRVSATVIASCRYAADALASTLPPERVHLAPNGVAGPPAGFMRRTDPAAPRIGMIGRIGPEKGQEDFLRAAEMLPGCRFFLCGEVLFGDRGAVEYGRAVRARARASQVEFLGWRDDIWSVLAGTDLLVVPSGPREATTRVILEAAACGVPSIAYASGGIPEVIEDGVTGFLVRPSEPRALAEGIRQLLVNRALLDRAGGNARRGWRERYSLEAYRGRILPVIEAARAGWRP